MSAAHALENFGSAVLVDNGPPSSSQRTRRDAGIDRATHSAWMVPFANNRGFGEACNAGASAVPRAKLILLVNPDAEVSAATVEKLVSALSLVPTLGIVSAMLVDRGGTQAESGGRFPSVFGLVFGKLARVRRRGSEHVTSSSLGTRRTGVEVVDWVSGAVMMIRREAWDAVGGFDPAFFLYYEDIDLCRRVRAAGWEVGIVPDATAIHESGGSQWRPGTRTRVERIYFESQAYYFRKHYGRLMEWLLRAVRFPYLATSLRRRFLERHGVRIRVASDPA
jgi:N-acetylglucosaminyl-diphospho-decaprenol L-rhamnosyltransferase